jgi:hypothetical protein
LVNIDFDKKYTYDEIKPNWLFVYS